MDLPIAYIRTVTKEMAGFFKSLHEFCIDYEHKLTQSVQSLPTQSLKNKCSTTQSSKEQLKPIKRTRARTAFNVFFQEQTQRLKKEGKMKIGGTELAKLIASDWKKLGLDEKAFWVNKAASLSSQTRMKHLLNHTESNHNHNEIVRQDFSEESKMSLETIKDNQPRDKASVTLTMRPQLADDNLSLSENERKELIAINEKIERPKKIAKAKPKVPKPGPPSSKRKIKQKAHREKGDSCLFNSSKQIFEDEDDEQSLDGN